MNATQRRAAGSGERTINVYPPDTTLGWNVIRQIEPAEAAKMLSLGKADLVNDQFGNFWGIRIRAKFKTEEELVSQPGPTSITAHESHLVAGLGGRSRTMNLREDEKLALQVPEDPVERAIRKVQQWPFPASRIDDGSGDPVYGDRAPRVYPHAG
jgi:hypothetical protein